jgi:GT2 family glycosyltransferase
MLLSGLDLSLFDPAYYAARYPDAPRRPEAALEHFLDVGLLERRWPNALFDPLYYESLYPDSAVSGLDPFAHYVLHGAALERTGHLLFDAEYYVVQEPAAAGHALAHFLRSGGREGRDPHPLFDSARYKRAGTAGQIPILHYLESGSKAGRQPHPLFDTAYYLANHPDVAAASLDPLDHYLRFGEAEHRKPCEFFDPRFYTERYPDVGQSGISPLLHFVTSGHREFRDPHPAFSTSFYVDAHMNGLSGDNPLVHYLEVGRGMKLPINQLALTEKFIPVSDPVVEVEISRRIDVIIPVYGGFEETRACIESVLAAGLPANARLVLIDDSSPEPEIVAYLDSLADLPSVLVLHNVANRGFVATVNRGMALDVEADVVLLNSDTEVAHDWVTRLAQAAHRAGDIATATAFTNNGTICSFPRFCEDNDLPSTMRVSELDAVFARVNRGRSVDLPTAVGSAMYVRREALVDVGYFDVETFGKGYGEENDFCMRAARRGWRHVLAADVFVYHKGGVSFAGGKTARIERALEILRSLYPEYDTLVARNILRDAALPYRLAVIFTVLRESPLPKLLFVTHDLGGGIKQHIDELVWGLRGRACILQLSPSADGGVRLETLAAPLDFSLTLQPEYQRHELEMFARLAGVSRVHIHHAKRIPLDMERLIADLGVPFDFTVHDFYTVCPQVNLIDEAGSFCGQPGERECNACIARRPNELKLDIDSWRSRFAWLTLDADRVIVPSRDTAKRMRRYFPGRAIEVAPHPEVRDA